MAATDHSSSDAGNFNSSAKNAWSQIVRSKDGAPPTKKLPQVANSQQIAPIAKEPTANQVRGQTETNAELCGSPSESTLDADNVASVADARASDEAFVRDEEVVEGLKAVVDVNAITASAEAAQDKSQETSHGDLADPRVSRPPWRKPPVGTDGDVKPQPVMGATAWPALTEALNMKKSSESRKIKASPLKSSHPEAVASVQESVSRVPLHSGEGSNYQQGKNKPSFKGGSVGIGRHAFQPIENGASFLEHPAMGTHGAPEQSAKPNMHARVKGNFSANPVMDKDRNHHHRNDGAGSFHNNNRKWRNNHRDQGRAWHNHGRAYENAGDMVTLLHEQRIGPRNMPRHQPFMNMNHGFYPPMQHFQNSGMYYMPHGGPEFVHGPPYFPPMAPPGGVIGLDPFSLRSMLIKQVDYYFSVENLCRDVFLRTHMDEEGFVPVSVIAQFNRIRNLSNNPVVILDALQGSEVVEVQHDRIRRRSDRGKWRLLRDQVYAVKPVQENRSGNLSEREVKPAQIASFADTNIGPAVERVGDGGADARWEGANNGSAKASVISQTDAESVKSAFDRLNGRVDLEEKREHDGIKSAAADDTNLLSSDASTQSSFSRGGSRGERAVCSASANNAAGFQNSGSTTLQDRPEATQRSRVAIFQDNTLSDARCLEGGGMASQAAADGKPVCWKAPEGFWMGHSTFLMGEQAALQPRESDFVLKMSQEDGVEHPGEANDRELDRLINVSHTSLGSFIAVP